jgi:anti-sigma factor RsiW
MPEGIQQLDDASLLVLYLADELSADERAVVERRMAQDAGLAGQLEQLRAAQQSSEAAFQNADAVTRLPMHMDTAVRRVSRAMKQWRVDRLVKKPAAPAPRRYFHIPWWGYASAALVGIIVTVVVWSSNLPDATAPTDEQMASELLDSVYPSEEAALDDTHEQLTMLRSREDDMDSVFLRFGERQ